MSKKLKIFIEKPLIFQQRLLTLSIKHNIILGAYSSSSVIIFIVMCLLPLRVISNLAAK